MRVMVFDKSMMHGVPLPEDHTGPLVLTEMDNRGLMVGYCYDPEPDPRYGFVRDEYIREFIGAALSEMGMVANFADPLIVSYSGEYHANIYSYFPIVYGGKRMQQYCDNETINRRFIDTFYNREGSTILARILLRDPE